MWQGLRARGFAMAAQPRALGGLLLACALLAVASAAGAAPIVVQHAKGETTLAERPRRVLVFDPAVLDTLDALGVEVAGVPGSNIPDYLAAYRADRYLKIGTLFEPDYEAVAAAAPDLIIVAARSAAKYGELAKIAPTIDLTIDPARFIAGAKANVETLGRIFGKDAQAQVLTGRIDAAVARMRADAPKTGSVLMIMVNGGKLTAYGAGSRFGWIHDDLGLAAVAKGDQATHGDVISFEYILKTDPDWLIVLDRDVAVGRGADAARKVLDNDLMAATRAAKADRIIYVDPVRWYIVSGGGAALPRTLEDLASALEARPAAP